MKIFTIGFTQKSAEQFFNALRESNVKRIVDVRVNNTSQLSGFARSADLKFFTETLIGASYIHLLALAPTRALLREYRDGSLSWDEYSREYLNLLETRPEAERALTSLVEGDCLLCSEAVADYCHRRLLVGYLMQIRPDIEVLHL